MGRSQVLYNRSKGRGGGGRGRGRGGSGGRGGRGSATQPQKPAPQHSGKGGSGSKSSASSIPPISTTNTVATTSSSTLVTSPSGASSSSDTTIHILSSPHHQQTNHQEEDDEFQRRPPPPAHHQPRWSKNLAKAQRSSLSQQRGKSISTATASAKPSQKNVFRPGSRMPSSSPAATAASTFDSEERRYLQMMPTATSLAASSVYSLQKEEAYLEMNGMIEPSSMAKALQQVPMERLLGLPPHLATTLYGHQASSIADTLHPRTHSKTKSTHPNSGSPRQQQRRKLAASAGGSPISSSRGTSSHPHLAGSGIPAASPSSPSRTHHRVRSLSSSNQQNSPTTGRRTSSPRTGSTRNSPQLYRSHQPQGGGGGGGEYIQDVPSMEETTVSDLTDLTASRQYGFSPHHRTGVDAITSVLHVPSQPPASVSTRKSSSSRISAIPQPHSSSRRRSPPSSPQRSSPRGNGYGRSQNEAYLSHHDVGEDHMDDWLDEALKTDSTDHGEDQQQPIPLQHQLLQQQRQQHYTQEDEYDEDDMQGWLDSQIG